MDKRKVKDILVPWASVTKMAASAHYTEVLDLIRTTRYTRFPVINQEESLVGILHAKDFNSEAEISRLNWNELIRPALFINAEEPILNALKAMQSKKSHIAAVRNKGEVLGIVTLEDIFEEVVGDIYDDDDNPQYLLSSNSKIRTMNLRIK